MALWFASAVFTVPTSKPQPLSSHAITNRQVRCGMTNNYENALDEHTGPINSWDRDFEEDWLDASLGRQDLSRATLVSRASQMFGEKMGWKSAVSVNTPLKLFANL